MWLVATILGSANINYFYYHKILLDCAAGLLRLSCWHELVPFLPVISSRELDTARVLRSYAILPSVLFPFSLSWSSQFLTVIVFGHCLYSSSFFLLIPLFCLLISCFFFLLTHSFVWLHFLISFCLLKWYNFALKGFAKLWKIPFLLVSKYH